MRAAAALGAALLLLGAAPPKLLETEVRAFADAFDTAQQEGDRAALERMIADDLILISSTGRREGKIDLIAGFTDPHVKYGPFVIFDRTVTILAPDAAIVGGTAVLPGTAGGKPFTARIRFTDVFKKRDGVWKAVYIHATKVPAPSSVTIRRKEDRPATPAKPPRRG